MNNTLWKIHFLFITLYFLSISLKAQQKMTGSNGKAHSFSIKYNPTHKLQQGWTKTQLLIIDYEKIWKSKHNQNLFRTLRVGSGIGITDKFNFPIFTVNYNYFYGKGKHFFEFGLGGKIISASAHINLGYRLLLKNNFQFLFMVQPSTYAFFKFFEGIDSPGRTNFVDFSFSFGYKLNSFKSQNFSSLTKSFFQRFSIQFTSYPVSFVRNGEFGLSALVGVDYLAYQKNKYQFGFTSHLGIDDDVLGDIGIYNLYGNLNHKLELNLNILFVLLQNPNYEYQYDIYKLLQPQLGYRYQCQKIPMFARIAYAPYIRTLDWKREGGLHHNMVLGVGYRFGK